ncbi:hypothetical protein FSP39_023503 [Pinctada imbricata]|uniref:Triosephosphate isomerase n=1 Tax=Pinctada imbricata TaxID=66713 RepID=A0AA89C7G9_PINIB|nr:hypothetical protein FSP39_023503 [Pinctada imbricata]
MYLRDEPIPYPLIYVVTCYPNELMHLLQKAVDTEKELIGEKIKYALSEGLNILVCSGETKEDKDSGKADDVIRRQIINITENVDKNQWNKIVIAYEAFWTVGTGQSLPVKEAQRILKSIRSIIAERVSQHIAEQARLIYAGSVNTENCKEFAAQPDIDGLLVGGASLKPEFVDIINVAKRI